MSRSYAESDSIPPSSPSLTLLRLPAEIRYQIYAFAIPVTRLCRRKHCSANPMARHHCLYCADRLGYDEPRTVSNLLYVCRSTYQDCCPILYSKAILEIAPIRLPGHLTADLPAGSADQNHISAPVTQYFYLRQRYGRSRLQLTHNRDAVATLRAICDQEIWATRASLQPESGKLELAASATRQIPHVHVLKMRRLGD